MSGPTGSEVGALIWQSSLFPLRLSHTHETLVVISVMLFLSWSVAVEVVVQMSEPGGGKKRFLTC